MNVVCLVDETPDGVSFTNRVHEAVGVDLALLSRARSRRRALARKYRSSGLRGIADAMRERADQRIHAAARRRELDRWLECWRSLSETIPVLRTDAINDRSSVERVRELGDDLLLLVHADVIVGHELVASCRMGLNLHWGLSPYYRGTRCTEWALLHWDPCNIGVTIHHLTEDIDGGAIVGQARATIAARDTVHGINAQLTALGTKIAIDAARAVRQGEHLRGVPQDLTKGFQTFKRQWSGQLRRHVARLERDGLDRMIAAPSRGLLPIVEPVFGR